MAEEETWHAEIWKGSPDSKWRGAMSGFMDPGAFAGEIGNPEYGPLFAYMYRRFGVPEFGSDNHKEIANWYITTPDEAVMLCVSPRPSGGRYSFGYMINTAVYHEGRGRQTWAKGNAAIKRAMKDLLAPVYVRDVPINAVGRMEDDVEGECPCFRWAGYGVDHKYFKDEYGESKKSEDLGKSEDLEFAEKETEKLKIALAESVKLQSHGAELLNMQGGRERMVFKSSEKWIERLQKIGKIPKD